MCVGCRAPRGSRSHHRSRGGEPSLCSLSALPSGASSSGTVFWHSLMPSGFTVQASATNLHSDVGHSTSSEFYTALPSGASSSPSSECYMALLAVDLGNFTSSQSYMALLAADLGTPPLRNPTWPSCDSVQSSATNLGNSTSVGASASKLVHSSTNESNTFY